MRLVLILSSIAWMFVGLLMTTQAQPSDCDYDFTHSAIPFARDVEWSPTGEQVAVLGEDALRLVNLMDETDMMIELEGIDTFDIAYSTDGRMIAVAYLCNQQLSYQGKVAIYDTESGDHLQQFEGSPGAFSVSFFDEDTKLLIGGHQIQIWSLADDLLLDTFGDYEWGAQALALSPDEQYLIAGNESEGGHLWDLETAQTVSDISESVVSVDFAVDGSYAVIGAAGGRIALFDMATYEIRQTDNTGIGLPFVDILIHPTDDLIIAQSQPQIEPVASGWIITMTRDGTLISNLYSDAENFAWSSGLALSPDGEQLATSADGITLTLWNLSDSGLGDIPPTVP